VLIVDRSVFVFPSRDLLYSPCSFVIPCWSVVVCVYLWRSLCRCLHICGALSVGVSRYKLFCVDLVVERFLLAYVSLIMDCVRMHVLLYTCACIAVYICMYCCVHVYVILYTCACTAMFLYCCVHLHGPFCGFTCIVLYLCMYYCCTVYLCA